MQPIVPRYSLYGEPLRAADGDFVHLEELDDRSRPAEWQIHPHAHADLHQVFWIREGRGTITAEGEETAFAAPCAIIVPAGVVHGFVYATSSSGRVLTISELLLRSLAQNERAFLVLFESVNCLATADNARFEAALNGIRQEQAAAAVGQRAALAAYLSLLLVSLARLGLEQSVSEPMQLAGHVQIVTRFRAAIDEHYAENLSISQYCGIVGTTMSRLRNACRMVACASPGQMIAGRVISQAKRLLRYSDLPISEIAYQLGFKDPAYFSRFFARTAGTTPSAFRRGK